MKWYSIGAFTFPSTWGALVAAFIITGIFIWLHYGKNSGEWFGNSVFWFIITWKFSVILFDFSGFIQQPLTALYFNGGYKGFWLGVTVALVYIYFKGARQQLISSWLLVVLVYEGASEFLADSSSILSAVNVLVGFFLFYLLLYKGKERIWLSIFIGMQLLVNFLQGSIASAESMAYIAITIAVLGISSLRRDSNE
ncbi:hypothetical protein FZC79_07970 [Rossellomorea vietnamensis]|uniref:Uncharacterized protein n=2 Tax=Rossellomorea TaxID=2837508 RepID=A0A5D4KFK8_9BACI|nr:MULTISPECIES: hypothetical protein [Rossellomorea]TYR76081.1 hypothetical protein FZC79_07970 [Rossellomorea vietnamensis]TYS71404.1 hypothetical protein FZC80_21785 [Rossellomorea aquimaris]